VNWDVRKAVMDLKKMKEKRKTNSPKGKTQNYFKIVLYHGYIEVVLYTIIIMYYAKVL